MTMKTANRYVAMFIALTLVAGMAAAGEGRGEFREARREYREQQRAENKEFREGLEGKSPAEICSALAERLKSRHTEHVARHKERYDKLVANIKAKMAERNVPEDKQAEILGAIEARNDTIVKHRETQYSENIDLLNKLAAQEDLTLEELKSTLKSHRQTQRSENKKFREEMRAGRRGRRGRFQNGGQDD
jgi:hypothetical protein